MSTTAAQHKGILVVHADGAASWWSRLVPAVAAVTVPVGPGAAVQVDAAHPERVLAWSVEAAGDLLALARALGDPELVDRVRVLTTSDADEVYVDDVRVLTERWMRRATVAAVDRCTVRPIAEGALLLDRAETAYATGDAATAEQLFAAAAPTLMNLGEQCLDGLLAGVVAADVTRVAAVAAEVLRSHGWGPDVRELSERLTEGLGATTDQGIASLLSDWVTAATAETHLGESVPLAVHPAYVDPEVVPPRLLAWTGADHADLIVEIDSGESALVSVRLDASADVRSPDVAELIAYAAEPDGTLVSVAPMHVAGRALTAALNYPGRDATALLFGVYRGDVDPTRLRTDTTEQVLIEVDRWMRDAFTRHRYAQALVYANSAENVEEVRSRQRTHLGIARTAADNAIELLESEGLRPGVDQAVAALLMGRRDAIKSYRETIAAAAPTISSWRPLLAEIVEPEQADDGDD